MNTDESFQKFWSFYPHRVAKKVAEKAFEKAIKEATLEQMLAGLERYKANKPAGQQWCHAATWLNNWRWTDQFAPPEPEKVSAYQQTRYLARIEERLKFLRGQQPWLQGCKFDIEFQKLKAERIKVMQSLNFIA